jgi:NADH-ubiquinone oxidoreductase chain 5
MGFPFLTGFYSKDLILEAAFSKFNFLGYFSYFLGTLGAFLTAFYSIRLVFLTFLSRPNGYKKIICYSSDSGLIIKFVLGCLILPSIFIGYFTKDMIAGFGTNFFENSIFISLKMFNCFDGEFIPLFFKVLPIHFSLLGFISAFFIYSYWLKFLFKIKCLTITRKIYIFLNKKWFFDKIYNEYFNQFFFKFGYSISYKFVDRGIFEIAGPTGLSFLVLNFGLILHQLQTNLLFHLMLTLFFTITVLIFFEFLQILLTTSNYYFYFLIEYDQILNYIFCLIINLFSLELVFINYLTLVFIKMIKK